MYPFTLAGEKKYYEAGTELTTFRCHDFTACAFICYDVRFPEIFRVAVRQNADLMIVIANWPQPREPHWLALLRARAIENQCYVAGVNRAGDDPHIHYGGRSIIFDPRGETVAEAGPGAQVLLAEIELQPLVDYRREFPALADMRPEFFNP
jgi:predicted amidohydrolase